MERAIGHHTAGFGALLRNYRRAAGLTQHELSSLAGVSVAAVRDLEQGRRLRPRPGSVARLAGALDLTAAQAGQLAVAAREASAAAMARRGVPARGLWVRVLGQLGIWRDGVSTGVVTPGQRAVLGLLAVSGGALVHREVIVDALWGERPPATAVNLVQAYVSRLRRRLDPGPPTRGRGGLLVSAGASYRLEVTADELDFLAFGEVVAQARAARQRGDLATACGCSEEAVGLWHGEPLADVDLLRGHVVVAELARQQAAAVMEYAEVACALGRPQDVLPHLQALTWREPLNEQAHGLLMIALAASGQQAAALQVFADLRNRLDEQLGVYPGAAVTDAHARVLRQDLPPGRGGARAAEASAVGHGGAQTAQWPWQDRGFYRCPAQAAGPGLAFRRARR
jgi:DNA-binding SARP family transcriptional activator/transcriptional regulator with XRE-family HTH domain